MESKGPNNRKMELCTCAFTANTLQPICDRQKSNQMQRKTPVVNKYTLYTQREVQPLNSLMFVSGVPCTLSLTAVKAAKYQRQMTLLICDLHDLYNITNNGTALNVNVTKYFMISGQRQAYRFGCFYEFFKLNKLHNTFFKQ